MGAPPLDIGQHGKVNVSRLHRECVTSEKWRAYCLYRGKDGYTRKLERRGEGRDAEAAIAAAQAKLDKYIRELNKDTNVHPGITRQTRLEEALSIFLADVKLRRRATTHDLYRRWVNARLIPGLGGLLPKEWTTARFQAYFDELAQEINPHTGKPLAASTRRTLRKILNGAMKLAIRDEVLTTNPIRNMQPIEGRTKPAQGFDKDEAAEFLDAVRKDKLATAWGYGDLIEFMFYTGTRVGEAIAVRHGDVNMSDEPVKVDHPVFGTKVIPPWSVWINGNIVRVTGVGLVRHDGKTDGSVDVVGVPQSLCIKIMYNRPADARSEDPVFPNSKGNFRCPSSTQANVRGLRKRIKFPAFTTHFGRRTYGTALDEGGHNPRKVADALRKLSIADTQRSYMVRGLKNPEAASAIEAFYS